MTNERHDRIKDAVLAKLLSEDENWIAHAPPDSLVDFICDAYDEFAALAELVSLTEDADGYDAEFREDPPGEDTRTVTSDTGGCIYGDACFVHRKPLPLTVYNAEDDSYDDPEE